MKIKAEFKSKKLKKVTESALKNSSKKQRAKLHKVINDAMEDFANDLYREVIKTAPVDTGTYRASWSLVEEKSGKFILKNKLPKRYMDIAGTTPQHNKPGSQITAPYNKFIINGFAAGAPGSYGRPQPWVYQSQGEGKLQNMNRVFYKWLNGGLGDLPDKKIKEFLKKEGLL